MDKQKIDIRLLFETLLKEMGPQGWWPAESKPEIILGAILVQNTNWSNVEKSLENLKVITQFSSHKIKRLSLEELELLIRPSGFYKNKAQTIKAVFAWFEQYNWDYQFINQQYGEKLREELLTIKGIGFETADVLLVYIFDRPVFIADAYARRLFGWLQDETFDTYNNLYKIIKLPEDFTDTEAQEFHGLIDEFGKRYLTNKTKKEKPFLNKADFLF